MTAEKFAKVVTDVLNEWVGSQIKKDASGHVERYFSDEDEQHKKHILKIIKNCRVDQKFFSDAMIRQIVAYLEDTRRKLREDTSKSSKDRALVYTVQLLNWISDHGAYREYVQHVNRCYEEMGMDIEIYLLSATKHHIEWYNGLTCYFSSSDDEPPFSLDSTYISGRLSRYFT
jgi:hypothetical protein